MLMYYLWYYVMTTMWRALNQRGLRRVYAQSLIWSFLHRFLGCLWSTTRKYYHFVSRNSRIVVENCVVGICNNGMFLEFHEFETKYLAGVYKRH